MSIIEKIDEALERSKRRILAGLPIKKTEEMYHHMKAEQARTMPNEIEVLFDQLDAKLAKLQGTLRDEPGRFCAQVMQDARSTLALARQRAANAVKCDVYHR